MRRKHNSSGRKNKELLLTERKGANCLPAAPDLRERARLEVLKTTSRKSGFADFIIFAEFIIF